MSALSYKNSILIGKFNLKSFYFLRQFIYFSIYIYFNKSYNVNNVEKYF